jgi:hypothetical protein
MEELNERLDLVYAAKTYAELAPVTADLPSSSGQDRRAGLATVSGPFGTVSRFGGQPSGSVAVAVLSAFVRKGNWVAPRKLSAVTVLGSGEIDLRDARYEEHTVTINAVSILGSIQVTVPEDADVQVNGVGVLGTFDHRAPGSGSSGGPRIVVNGLALLGDVQVKRKPSKQA